MTRTLTVDCHIDIPWIMTKSGPFDLSLDNGGVISEVDFPRMKKGKLDAAFFALYLSDKMQDELGPIRSFRTIQAQMAFLHNQKGSMVVHTAQEAFECVDVGMTPIFLGLEGGRLINKNLDLLKALRAGGVRYLTLTHNKNTDWADSATDYPQACGLTAFGSQVILECNKLGIVIDVSHTSDATASAAIYYSKHPVIASHSGCNHIIKHERNLTDDLIKRIAGTGGVVHVPFALKFIGKTYLRIADHIDHITCLVGSADNVGIGSDLDGAKLAGGIIDVSAWSDVVCEELSKKGYADHVIKKITGGNTLRIFS